jgi:hypothetical protein
MLGEGVPRAHLRRASPHRRKPREQQSREPDRAVRQASQDGACRQDRSQGPEALQGHADNQPVLDKSKKTNLSEVEKKATKRAAKSEKKQRRHVKKSELESIKRGMAQAEAFMRGERDGFVVHEPVDIRRVRQNLKLTRRRFASRYRLNERRTSLPRRRNAGFTSSKGAPCRPTTACCCFAGPELRRRTGAPARGAADRSGTPSAREPDRRG